MLASVVICTHNPCKKNLERVLEGLRLQSLDIREWELLLIDNSSETPLNGRYDLSWHPHARNIREETIGLTPARLRGIVESNGETIVFVDDDTVLSSSYLEHVLAISQEYPFIGAWCGSSIPEYEKPLPKWIGNEVWRLTVVDVERDIWGNDPDGAGVPFGAGLCVRRNVGLQFLDLCENDSNRRMLDRIGIALAGYGDVDLALCAVDIGLGVGRFMRLQLTHIIPAGRMTLDYFLRHAEGDASSRMLFRAIRGYPIEQAKQLNCFTRFCMLFHRIRTGISKEHFRIQQAHHLGLCRGYNLAISYLRRKDKKQISL